jgi:hypothetical protein
MSILCLTLICLMSCIVSCSNVIHVFGMLGSLRLLNCMFCVALLAGASNDCVGAAPAPSSGKVCVSCNPSLRTALLSMTLGTAELAVVKAPRASLQFLINVSTVMRQPGHVALH